MRYRDAQRDACPVIMSRALRNLTMLAERRREANRTANKGRDREDL